MEILELPSVPRDAGKLKAIIGQARAASRKRNLIRWAALNLCCWALFVVVTHAAPASPSPSGHLVYLPVISRER
jgi:hypothetical protein